MYTDLFQHLVATIVQLFLSCVLFGACASKLLNLKRVALSYEHQENSKDVKVLAFVLLVLSIILFFTGLYQLFSIICLYLDNKAVFFK